MKQQLAPGVVACITYFYFNTLVVITVKIEIILKYII